MAKPKKPSKKILEIRRLRETKPTGTGRILAAKNARRLELEFQCITLRTAGHSIRDIATTLTVDEGTVRACLERLLTRAVKETNESVEEARQLQMERLDQLLVKYQRSALGYSEEVDALDPISHKIVKKTVVHPPNQGAASLVLAIEQRRSKLCALDLPEVKKLEVSGVREYVGVDIAKV